MEIFFSAKLKMGDKFKESFKNFLQQQSNRIQQGFCRYGPVDRRQNYMTRLIMETKAYKRSGNLEHLFNIANYAFLESVEPENLKFHYDNKVGSITRGKNIGMD